MKCLTCGSEILSLVAHHSNRDKVGDDCICRARELAIMDDANPSDLLSPWCDGKTGAEVTTKWTDDYLFIFIIFKAEIELFHNDFPFPDSYTYSNTLCLRFLVGDTF